MAKSDLRLPHNAAGELYVDSSCIDCDTCRWMAPEHFTRREEQSSVVRQPETEDEWRTAFTALVSCPTSSIGTEPIGTSESGRPRRRSAAPGVEALPLLVDGPVLHTGYHGEGSFGAAAYLILRPEGNVLVDSPRFARPLVNKIEALGGVATIFLTHKDDVLDHEAWAAHFGATRVMHEADIDEGTRGVEHKVSGTEPVVLAPDLVVLPTPGHTRGSACLLAADRYLFTGDHMAWSTRLGHLYGFRGACWYDWSEVVRSTERLRGFSFDWVLPGHGRRFHAAPGTMPAELERCITWMQSGKHATE